MNNAIFWIEHVIRHGNVLKSPALELSSWQLAKLDIYAAILAAIILSILTVFFFFKICIKTFGSSELKSRNIMITKERKVKKN